MVDYFTRFVYNNIDSKEYGMKISKKEIAKFQAKEAKVREGHFVNNVEGMVQDRKNGEWYNPQQAFDKLMNRPEIIASFRRLKIR